MHGQERGRGFHVEDALRPMTDALVIDHTSQLPAQRIPVVPRFYDFEAPGSFKARRTEHKIRLQFHGQLSIFNSLFQPKSDLRTGWKDEGKRGPVFVLDDLAARLTLKRVGPRSVRFERTPGRESCWYPIAEPLGERGRLLGGFCARASSR